MGAAGSKEGDEGIITVVPAAASASRGRSPLPGPGSSRPGSRLSNHPDTLADPLLQHLQDLKAQGAQLDSTLFAAAPSRSSGSTTAKRSAATAAAHLDSADPDGLLADLAVSQQLSSDTQALNAAISRMVTEYQTWHREQMQALTQNQDYITRTIDQAETKADKAVRHVQQQTIKLKQVATGLSKASQLPLLLQQLTAATEALECQLHQLEQRADAVSVAAATAAAANSAAATNINSSSTSIPTSRSNSSGGSASSRGGTLRSWLGGGSVQQQQPGVSPAAQLLQQQPADKHGSVQQQQQSLEQTQVPAEHLKSSDAAQQCQAAAAGPGEHHAGAGGTTNDAARSLADTQPSAV